MALHRGHEEQAYHKRAAPRSITSSAPAQNLRHCETDRPLCDVVNYRTLIPA
jgi:hypothetical protein